MHCLLLLPNYKPLRKPMPIVPGDRCPRKLTFVGIKPLKTIVVVESKSRKLSLLLNKCARKSMPSVELCFLVTGVQKIWRPQMHNKFAMPIAVATYL